MQNLPKEVAKHVFENDRILHAVSNAVLTVVGCYFRLKLLWDGKILKYNVFYHLTYLSGKL